MNRIIYIPHDEAIMIIDMLNLRGEEIYSKYGVDKGITKKTVFSEHIKTRIYLIIYDKDFKPYVEGALFDGEHEVVRLYGEVFCPQTQSAFEGEWSFEYNGESYNVIIAEQSDYERRPDGKIWGYIDIPIPDQPLDEILSDDVVLLKDEHLRAYYLPKDLAIVKVIYNILCEYYGIVCDCEVYAGRHFSKSIEIYNIIMKDPGVYEVSLVKTTKVVTTNSYGMDLGAYDDYEKDEKCTIIVDVVKESVIETAE